MGGSKGSFVVGLEGGGEGRVRGEMAMRVHSVILGVPRVVGREGLDLDLDMDLEAGDWDWGRRMRQ